MNKDVRVVFFSGMVFFIYFFFYLFICEQNSYTYMYNMLFTQNLNSISLEQIIKHVDNKRLFVVCTCSLIKQRSYWRGVLMALRSVQKYKTQRFVQRGRQLRHGCVGASNRATFRTDHFEFAIRPYRDLAFARQGLRGRWCKSVGSSCAP